MKKVACVAVLAAGSGLAAGGAHADTMLAAFASGLQVTIAAPADTGDAGNSLDVVFRGARVQSIELFIDGALVKRQSLRTREAHGLITFALDPSILTDGGHEALVRAVEFDGSIATATTQFTVGAPAGEKARLTLPSTGGAVRGNVPAEVKVPTSVRSPYVNFSVDGSLAALVNSAPFTFNWDTEKIANGQHTLTIEIYDGESLARVQTIRRRLTVNNPGGFTRFQEAVEPASPGAAESVAPPSAARRLTPPAPGARARRAAPQAEADSSIATGSPSQVIAAPPRPSAIKPTPVAASSVLPQSADGPGPQAPAAPAAALTPHAPTAPMPVAGLNPAAATRANATADASTEVRTAKAVIVAQLSSRSAEAVQPVHNPLHTHPEQPVTAKSAMPASKPVPVAGHVAAVLRARRTAEAPHPQARTAAVLPVRAARRTADAPHAQPRIAAVLPVKVAQPAGYRSAVLPSKSAVNRKAARARIGFRVAQVEAAAATRPTKLYAFPVGGGHAHARISVGSLEIAYNSEPIQFDVAPRIEHGRALAPIRQVFEKSGGRVEWFQKTHTVRAYSGGQLVEMHIGSRDVMVNRHHLRLQVAPYIDHGRTIVSMSFLQATLGPRLQYNARAWRRPVQRLS